jgi:hypothetical protein
MTRFLPLLALLMAVAIAGPAIAQESSAEDWEGAPPPYPVTPEPEALPESPDGGPLLSHRVTGSVLRPRTSTDGTTINTSGGCIYNVSGSAFGVLNTPLFLPQGSTVDTLRMYYNDTSASNSSGWFTVYDLYGNVVTETAVNSAGNSGLSFNDAPLNDHVIDYSIYSYVLNWRPIVSGSTMQLCGFRIFYHR